MAVSFAFRNGRERMLSDDLTSGVLFLLSIHVWSESPTVMIHTSHSPITCQIARQESSDPSGCFP